MWPQDSSVQIVLIISIALVIGLAIWLGRGLKFRKSDQGIELTVEQQAQASQQNVTVADDIELKDAKVDKIAGVDGANSVDTSVSVANKAKMKNVEIKELVGVKIKQDEK